jgi:acyl-CoA thioesterase
MVVGSSSTPLADRVQTVAIHRPPEGEWVCLDAATVAEAHGIGLTRARLWDARGAFGVSLQSCVAERRPT